ALGIGPLVLCRFNPRPFLHRRSILRMNPLQKMSHGRLHPLSVVVKDAIHLLGPKNLESMHIPGPTAAAGQSLGLCQITLASPKGLLHFLGLGNTRNRPDELDFSMLARCRATNNSKVFCGAVGHGQAMFKVDLARRLCSTLQDFFVGGAIVGMSMLQD